MTGKKQGSFASEEKDLSKGRFLTYTLVGLAIGIIAVVFFAVALSLTFGNFIALVINDFQNGDAIVTGDTHTWSLWSLFNTDYVFEYERILSSGLTQAMRINLTETNMPVYAAIVALAGGGFVLIGVILGVVAYFSNKKLSALPVGFSLLGSVLAIAGLLWYWLGYRGISTSNNNSNVVVEIFFNNCTPISWMFLLGAIFGIVFAAFAPYIIDAKAASYAMKKAHEMEAYN